jgi:hypothetical protein
VHFVPALSGLGAPYWDPDARGTITGLTRGTKAAHLARATLEGIAFSVADLARAMEADMGGRIARLRVDGGASENQLLMQFQSDVLDVAIDRPRTWNHGARRRVQPVWPSGPSPIHAVAGLPVASFTPSMSAGAERLRLARRREAEPLKV